MNKDILKTGIMVTVLGGALVISASAAVDSVIEKVRSNHKCLDKPHSEQKKDIAVGILKMVSGAAAFYTGPVCKEQESL